MSKLALLGGEPYIKKNFEPYTVIGEEERLAVDNVMRKGILSKYIGSWGADFYGGEQVQLLEKEWQNQFKIEHAICVNSNTSGLIAALGALQIEPGDEVLVSPWSMSASATSILVWNAIPVFIDIEIETFNMNPDLIEAKITDKTKGIVLPHIFGHPADLDKIKAIADKYCLFIIEDSAQVPGSSYKGMYPGTIGDIGVFSLNYHKHIHCGEGGVCVTRNPELAKRMSLIRNHAEAVVGDMGYTNLINMIGFNFRLSELHAAVAVQQLRKLDKIIEQKRHEAQYLSFLLQNLKGLRTPIEKENCKHVYYMFPMLVDETLVGVSKKILHAALKAEGINNITASYINIHRYPMYEKLIAYGSQGAPWRNLDTSGYGYGEGGCPVAEKLNSNSFLNLLICFYHYTDNDLNQIGQAFHKVWSLLDELKEYEKQKENTNCIA